MTVCHSLHIVYCIAFKTDPTAILSSNDWMPSYASFPIQFFYTQKDVISEHQHASVLQKIFLTIK